MRKLLLLSILFICVLCQNPVKPDDDTISIEYEWIAQQGPIGDLRVYVSVPEFTGFTELTAFLKSPLLCDSVLYLQYKNQMTQLLPVQYEKLYELSGLVKLKELSTDIPEIDLSIIFFDQRYERKIRY